MKLIKSTVTPENYHLDHGPKLRDQLGATIKTQSDKVSAEYKKVVSAELKKLGVKNFEPDRWNEYIGHVGIIKLEVKVKNRNEIASEIEKRMNIDTVYLSRRKRELCKMLDPSGAKKFGVFARTKYGNAADKATIVKAHDEWLDLLSNCEC